MIILLVVGYVLVAVAAYVGALYFTREEVRGADDDPVGRTFFLLAFLLLSAVWPMTIGIFVLAAVSALIGRLIVAVMP